MTWIPRSSHRIAKMPLDPEQGSLSRGPPSQGTPGPVFLNSSPSALRASCDLSPPLFTASSSSHIPTPPSKLQVPTQGSIPFLHVGSFLFCPFSQVFPNISLRVHPPLKPQLKCDPTRTLTEFLATVLSCGPTRSCWCFHYSRYLWLLFLEGCLFASFRGCNLLEGLSLWSPEHLASWVAQKFPSD